MASIGKSKSVAVAFVGKVKTASQMIAIPLLLYHDALFGVISTQWLGTLLINIAAVLTVISMAHYLRRALPHASG
jgi:cardiolipin synthase (CMP-forming)